MFKRNEMVYRVQKKKKKNELSIALSCKHNSASLPRHFSRWPVCESCTSRHGYAHSVHHGRAHTVVPAAKTPQTRHVFTTSAFPKDCASRREPLFILLTRLPVKGHVFVFDNGLLLNTPDILDFFFFPFFLCTRLHSASVMSQLFSHRASVSAGSWSVNNEDSTETHDRLTVLVSG